MSEKSLNIGSDYRPLTVEERRLVQWMLENGSPDAKQFLPQLNMAEATSWRCFCGCASFNFAIAGHRAPPGVHIIADFLFGGDEDLCGIFLFESQGLLSGLEVVGYAVDPPKSLPPPESLRLYEVNKPS
jgi:hypothetical protein